MKLAFAIEKYFPYGGLQRDFLQTIKVAIRRGYQVDVYAREWNDGKKPEGVNVTLLPCGALMNHTRTLKFANELGQAVAEKNYDLVIGFNRLPGVDVYFMGDICFKRKLVERPWLRLLPRYRVLAKLEQAIFDKEGKTITFYINESEKELAKKFYQTPERRFYPVPPGMERKPLEKTQAEQARDTLRTQFNLNSDMHCLLFVASDYALKGIKTILKGMGELPEAIKSKTYLLVAGDDKSGSFVPLVKSLGLVEHVTFLGPRKDVLELMACADLLVHAPVLETGGKVLLEALVSGLPVLCSGGSGYSQYTVQAKAGIVLDDINQQKFSAALKEVLSTNLLNELTQQTQSVARTQKFHLGDVFMDHIEEIAGNAVNY